MNTTRAPFFLMVLSLAVFAASVSAVCADTLHDAWTVFAAPVLDPAAYGSTMDHHRARVQAIAAIGDGAEKNARLSEALGYFYLRDFQYLKAKDMFEAAAKRSREPRIRFLLAQTKAILLLAEPEKRGEQCKEPIGEFRKAANQEPDNAVPLLQAASVAFDCNRTDLALPLITEAIKRPACRLYTADVPEDLAADPAKAAAAWYWVQSALWNDAISRVSNCARWLIQLGDRASIAGEKARARMLYQQAVEVGGLLTRCSPPLGVACAAGLEAQKQALTAQTGPSGGPTPEELAAVRARLEAVENQQKAFKRRQTELQRAEQSEPPKSVQAIMDNQKKLVEGDTASGTTS